MKNAVFRWLFDPFLEFRNRLAPEEMKRFVTLRPLGNAFLDTNVANSLYRANQEIENIMSDSRRTKYFTPSNPISIPTGD